MNYINNNVYDNNNNVAQTNGTDNNELQDNIVPAEDLTSSVVGKNDDGNEANNNDSILDIRSNDGESIIDNNESIDIISMMKDVLIRNDTCGSWTIGGNEHFFELLPNHPKRLFSKHHFLKI